MIRQNRHKWIGNILGAVGFTVAVMPARAATCHCHAHAHDDVGEAGEALVEIVDEDSGVFGCSCEASATVPGAHAHAWGSNSGFPTYYKSYGGHGWFTDGATPKDWWWHVRTGTGRFIVDGPTSQSAQLRVRIRAAGTVLDPGAPTGETSPLGPDPSQGMFADAFLEVFSRVDISITQGNQSADLFHGTVTLAGPGSATAGGLEATGDFDGRLSLNTSPCRNSASIMSDWISTTSAQVITNAVFDSRFDCLLTIGAPTEGTPELPWDVPAGEPFGGAASFVVEIELLDLSGLLTLRPVTDPVIRWSTINNGGAIQASGGIYSLSGGIGEFDAGPVLTGGAYELLGGFWGWKVGPETPPGPAPYTFSITSDSPTVTDFIAFQHDPDDLLVRGPEGDAGEDAGGQGPGAELQGSLFRGEGAPIDVDAISSNHGVIELDAPQAYRIVFGVPRDTDALRGCVHEQHVVNQEAADLFVSTDFFRPVLPDGREVVGEADSNDCLINQAALDLVPTLPPDELADDPIDDLDGFDFQSFDADDDGELDIALYFSVPSALGAGADIFYLPAGSPETGPDGPIALYSFRGQLGLGSGDDIDGLVAFDADADAGFSEGDAVLLSLRPDSPALGGAGDYHFGGTGDGADVFLVYKDAAGATWISQFAHEHELGFMAPTIGQIDALEVIIGEPPLDGDADADCDVDLGDAALFTDRCMLGPGVVHPSGCEPFDFDADVDVDLRDFAAMQGAFTG